MTTVAPSERQAFEASLREKKYLLLGDGESSEPVDSPRTIREAGHAVYWNFQDPGKRSAPVELPPWRTESIAACHLSPLNGEPFSPRVTQNDIVVLAGERGTWQVVAPVNGSKADIRRREGFDIRVITAALENLTVVRCAGSPESNY